jgi:hypothetical protein
MCVAQIDCLTSTKLKKNQIGNLMQFSILFNEQARGDFIVSLLKLC